MGSSGGARVSDKLITALEIEIELAKRFCYRRNIIVPNVSWGAGFRHELDMMVITPAGWATEIEIKVSKADLKADAKKPHGHESKRIRQLYFAYPEYLGDDCAMLVPERAGIITVAWRKDGFAMKTFIKRTPKVNKDARRLNDDEISKLLHLGCMRVWSLKEHNRDCHMRRAVAMSTGG